MVLFKYFYRLTIIPFLFLTIFLPFKSFAETEIMLNSGIGIIGDGDLLVTSIGFGSKHTFFNCLAVLPGVSTSFGNQVVDVNSQFGLDLPYQINRYDNYYAIQGDLSIGIFKRIGAFTPMVFAGGTPTYESQVGSSMYLSSTGTGVLHDIDIWYGMDRGFSFALHYGVSLAFKIFGIEAGIKGIYRFDNDNTWAVALFNVGFKLPELETTK